MQRDAAAQAEVQRQAAGLALYQYTGCPFCIKVRRELHKLNVPVELRDPSKDAAHREALQTQGGRVMVPCLRITEDGQDRWLYESDDIIAYLRSRFGPQAAH